jgi:hypothetical protein
MSLIATIYDRLRLDPVLTGTLTAGQYTGILKGGVWTRPLKREGAAATPEAFYDAAQGKMNRPAAVVVDGGMAVHRQIEAIPHAYVSLPRIVLYAPAGQGGKNAMNTAFSRIYDLLHNYRFLTEENTYASLVFADRTTLLDSEEFIGALSSIMRFQVTSRYRTGE